ncbi:MAG: NAD(P)/FAD-dependent oxidoreductase [Prochlorotrichaceae cyanobacterium]
MIRLTEIKLPLDHSEADLEQAILAKLRITAENLRGYQIFKRSPDARNKAAIVLVYILDVDTPQESRLLKRFKKDPHISLTPDMSYRPVATAPSNLSERPIIVGMGPAGLFAGLLLAQMGFCPLILERGKSVRERTKDTFGFWKEREDFNPESNVQFGEGGAGMFSDGKLYSQVRDPQHYSRKVLLEFVEAGASAEILYVNRPHIGTFKLVGIVQNIRRQIQDLGGEIRFQSRVVDVQIEDSQLKGIFLENGEYLATQHLILAIGHSARDTFQMLFDRGVYIEPKPFSIGFRIEHPQHLIDRCRYGDYAGHKILGAADYRVVHHCSNGRSVYSFCMCPGGLVVAATSETGKVVTNGMSQYSRNERNANSGLVVGITPEDFPGHALAGMELQRQLEAQAFRLGGENYHAPAQLVGDFLAKRPSQSLGSVKPSYAPGVTLTDLSQALPDYAIVALREAIPALEQKIKGFALPDATLTGVETRTSSPVRIQRNEFYQSVNTQGLYPAGEGAGYAGGILSAAIDGIKVAEAVALNLGTGKSSDPSVVSQIL